MSYPPWISTLMQIPKILKEHPNFPLDDLFSEGQIDSKLWLLNELAKVGWTDFREVYLCAGWAGSLATLMLADPRFEVTRIYSLDKDPACTPVADTLNRQYVKNGWKFKAATVDIMSLNFIEDRIEVKRSNGESVMLNGKPDLIINTSCEHMPKFSNWWEGIPLGKRVVLQSNSNTEIEDHVNCVKSLDEFKAAAPLSSTLYSGSIDLPKYSRFMLIGTK